MSKKKETKLSKFMKLPIKMVVKARDLYIKGMNQVSSHDLGGAMAFGIPTACHVSALQRSFSASHSQISVRDKEHRVAELVRAASARNMTIDKQPGVQLKMKKAKSLRSTCTDHHGFERIGESSPLISFESKNKMLQKNKKKETQEYIWQDNQIVSNNWVTRRKINTGVAYIALKLYIDNTNRLLKFDSSNKEN